RSKGRGGRRSSADPERPVHIYRGSIVPQTITPNKNPTALNAAGAKSAKPQVRGPFPTPHTAIPQLYVFTSSYYSTILLTTGSVFFLFLRPALHQNPRSEALFPSYPQGYPQVDTSAIRIVALLSLAHRFC